MAPRKGFLSRSPSGWYGTIRKVSRFWPLALPLILLIPSMKGFPYPSAEASYSDLVITHYPNAHFLRSAISQWQAIPLWSPTIMSGYPFFANPLSGLYYPPGWLELLLPLPFGFNFMVLLHVLWGGIGTYLLVKSEGAEHKGALLGALAFAAMPKLFAHYGAGHLTLLYAIPWTPWLLLVSRSGRLGSETESSMYPPSKWLPAICMTMIFFADVRWALYAGLIWLAYVYVNRLQIYKTRRFLFTIRHITSQLMMTVLLIAPLGIPFWQFVSLSTRANLTQQESFVFSLPFSRFLGLLYPDFGGFHEWMIYPGAMILLLFVFCIFARDLKANVKFWILVAFVCWIFSLGDNIPFLPSLARIPLLGLLRVPARASFISGMAIAIVAAHGFDVLTKKRSEANITRAYLAAIGLSSLTITLAIGIMLLTGKIERNLIWAACISLLGVLGAGLAVNRPEKSNIWSILIIGLVVVDLGVTNSTLFSSRQVEQTLSEGESIAQYVTGPDDKTRIYSPSFSVPQQTAVYHGLELADGVDPMQLMKYAEFMEGATGVARQGYQLSIPPFASGDPDQDNIGSSPDAGMLGLLNVKYVVSSFPLDVEDMDLQSNIDGTFVYENLKFMPRAWVQPVEDNSFDNVRAVEFQTYEANRIELTAEGPGLLVISEIDYPGWVAHVDGIPSEITSVYDILRGISLPAGRHEITLSFRPMSFYVGIAMAIMGWSIVLFSFVRRGRRHDAEALRYLQS